jgi:hypothetical protein
MENFAILVTYTLQNFQYGPIPPIREIIDCNILQNASKSKEALMNWKILLPLLLVSTQVLASDDFSFKHIKLGSLLKKRVEIIKNADDYNDIGFSSRAKFTPGQRVLDENDKHLARALKLEIGDGSISVSKSARSSQAFIDDKTKSLIYKSILAFLGKRFQQIGSDESQSIIDHAQNFDLGESNFSGFTWQKPFGSYGLHVNRKITPDFKDPSKWIVLDTFEISVNAQTFLKKLMDAGLASLDGIGFDAFAGLTFKRKYSYYHFADSYRAGLTSDFTRLFLPFLQFSRKKLVNMAPYNYLKKEDYLSVKAGVSVETPPIYGLDLKGGVMMELSRSASVSAQSLGPQDDPAKDEFLRVSINKEFKLKTNVSVDLQLDFFKLLKLTLLSYELEYSIAKQDKIDLSFYNKDKDKLLSDALPGKELSRLLRLINLKLKYLEPNVVSSEQRKKSDLSSEYSAFIFGKMKRSKTESVKLIKDEKVKVLFRHTAENVAVEKSLLSRLWATVVYKLFDFETRVKNISYKSKVFSMEYDSDRRQNTTVNATEKFSIELEQKVEVQKTTGWTRKRFRKLMAKSLIGLSNLNTQIAKKVLNQQLVGPMVLNQKIMIQKNAMNALHVKSESSVAKNLARVCHSKRINKWADPKKRRRYLKSPQVGKELCVKELFKRYASYMRDVENDSEMNLDKLKKFLTFYLKKSKTYENLVNLFGHDRIFVHGRFTSYTDTGESYITYFNQGVFSGLGLIESHKRSTSMVPIVYNEL